MSEHEKFAQWDAAYVLGALEPADRRLFEEHLENCERCQGAVSELSALPGLLSRAHDPEEVAALVPQPPADLFEKTARRAASARRRRDPGHRPAVPAAPGRSRTGACPAAGCRAVAERRRRLRVGGVGHPAEHRLRLSRRLRIRRRQRPVVLRAAGDRHQGKHHAGRHVEGSARQGDHPPSRHLAAGRPDRRGDGEDPGRADGPAVADGQEFAGSVNRDGLRLV
ncbi:hypothetical protein GT020_08150 [Glutamicibacter soli]|uniref:Putative zinc-finger domain-containing protein n=1 Tax=Glutamicibacter soli TaxID=453836 RepID=A0A6L9G471_9MICC|nr:hypothetical protein [Glutamicibacter soli]